MKYALIFLLASSLFWSCKSPQPVLSTDDGQIEIQILQLNDVYEIAPLSGGEVGGMARVATVRNELLEKNPNTLTVLSGDFLNPSVIGTVKYNGERIRGAQMVEAMNVAGVDLVTFGNHEFDIKEADLQKRIDESQFEWVSSNVLHVKDSMPPVPFRRTGGSPFPKKMIKTYTDSDGTSFKLGILAVTLPVNKPDYVAYEDVTQTAIDTYEQLKGQCDAVVAITHLAIEEDKALAEKLQEVPLFLGGHDHTNMRVRKGNVYITKADANAKTVYIHNLSYNHKTKRLNIRSELKEINDQIPEESTTAQIVEKWKNIAYEGFKAGGIDPDKVVIKLKKPIDGKEDEIRFNPTILSTTIVKAMRAAAPNAKAAIMNTGSIRIDDWLDGVITQYDIVRILPYGGALNEVKLKGRLLKKVVDVGLRQNIGLGGYLALDGISYDPVTRGCTFGGKKVEDEVTYHVVMPGFLTLGLEQNLEFLTADNTDVLEIIKPSQSKTDLRQDIKLALINYLENNPIPKRPNR